MTQDHDAVRMLLGAYVLGGLDAADRRTVEDHLPTCAICRDEVAELAVLPGLLHRLTPSEAAADLAPAVPTVPTAPTASLLASVTHTVQRQRRRRRLLTAVGGLVAAAVTTVALVFGIQANRTPPVDGTVITLGPVDSAGRGEARLITKQWGTAVTLQAWQMPADGPFSLEIYGPNGREECAAVWGRTTDGHMVVNGATSLKPEEIRSVKVMGSGKILLQNA